MTVAATQLDPDPLTVTPEEAAEIPRQRPVEPRPSRDFRRYYRSLDRGIPTRLDPATRSADPVVDGQARHRHRLPAAGFGCGDLVAFFEHVSHRIPGRPDRFAMSPAKDFANMRADDIGILSTEGECQQLEGTIPGGPVSAGTTVTYSRPAPMWPPSSTPTSSWGVPTCWPASLPRRFTGRPCTACVLRRHPPSRPPACCSTPPIEPRWWQLLGDGPWVHARSHGTDYCARRHRHRDPYCGPT